VALFTAVVGFMKISMPPSPAAWGEPRWKDQVSPARAHGGSIAGRARLLHILGRSPEPRWPRLEFANPRGPTMAVASEAAKPQSSSPGTDRRSLRD